MSETAPKLSICLPVLNGVDFIAERMQSIMMQSFTDWELIVCDSFSDDGTWEFLKAYESDPRVRLYQVPREGLYAGWNECLSRIRGEFFYIATADDTAEPDFLLRVIQALEQSSEASFVVSRTMAIDQEGAAVESFDPDFWRFMQPWCRTLHRISGASMFLILASFDGNWGSVTGLVFRSTVLKKIGLFRTDMGYIADCEWSLRLCLNSDWLLVSSYQGATWRIHEQQASRRWRFEDSRIYYHAIKELISSRASNLPNEWMLKKGWKKVILRRRATDYEVHSNLFLGTLLRNPKLFVKRLRMTLFSDWWIFWRRASRSFRWSSNLKFDSSEWSLHLIKKFKSPWPPIQCENHHP